MDGRPHPVIDVRGLGHLYDGERGLERLDLQVGAGEAVGLVGHNGSGKTTALQCIAGLLSPTSGSVRVLDADPLVEPAGIHVRRALAYVSDAPVFYRSFTVAEHLELIGAAHGVIDDLGRGAWAARAAELLSEFGLYAHRDARPDQLSAGLRQRTQLACTFARPFRALVLDEPTLRLDLAGQELVGTRIKAALAGGVTVLVTSHALDFVRDIAARAVVLEDGTVAASGSWDEIAGGATAGRLGLSK